MIYPVKNTKQVEDSKALLLSQWRNSPNIQILMETYSEQIQAIENEWFELMEALGIDTAHDYALDIVGKKVGELRQGKNDIDYRNAILTKIFINTSSGTPDEVIAAAIQITGATEINYSEQYPAEVVLEVIGAEYISKAATIKKTLPAGVDLVFEKKLDIEQTQTYVGVAYSFEKEFESNPAA